MTTLYATPSRLPHQTCDADKPMPQADKDRFQWTHADAEYIEPFFNLALYKCPNCGLTFHAARRQ